MHAVTEVRPIAEPEVAVLDAAYPERESRHQLRLRRQLAGEGTYFVAWSGEAPAGWVFLIFPKHASERALGGAQLSDLQVAAPYRLVLLEPDRGGEIPRPAFAFHHPRGRQTAPCGSVALLGHLLVFRCRLFRAFGLEPLGIRIGAPT
jgi:hypothetical protein